MGMPSNHRQSLTASKKLYQFPFTSASNTREKSDISTGSLTLLWMDGPVQAEWFLQHLARTFREVRRSFSSSTKLTFLKWSIAFFSVCFIFYTQKKLIIQFWKQCVTLCKSVFFHMAIIVFINFKNRKCFKIYFAICH
jgi:hypothetical protein